jgi:membrane-associated phospholipid phosphatase
MMALVDRAAARYFAGGAACLLIFVLMALGVTSIWNVVAFDQAFAGWVASWRNPALTDVMLAITSLGDGAYLKPMGVLVVIALAMQRAWRPAAATATAFLLLPLLVNLIKSGTARTRPTIDLYAGADGFSFPSGHAANATLIYGALAVLVFRSLTGPKRWIATAALALLALLIAASRVYVGAHWPSDALAGLALGGLLLAGLASVLAHPSHSPATPRTTHLLLACFALTAPLYAWYALPFAHTFYQALS